MKAISLRLRNFRNYKDCFIEFKAGKNIVIGENAQGKTNLLEAIDLLSTGKSQRASEDRELIFWGETHGSIELVFSRGAGLSDAYNQTLSIDWQLKDSSGQGRALRSHKLIKVNGVLQPSIKGLLGHLLTVSFSSSDLSIIRGGPRFRREWLDSIALRLQPAYHDTLASYAKTLAQRNKILKTFGEKGRIGAKEEDELYVWDRQLARFGTLIIKARLRLLAQLLPEAEAKQSLLSSSKERLSIDYAFKAQEIEAQKADFEQESDDDEPAPVRPMDELESMEKEELAFLLLKLMKERRYLELRRRQSLVGPHRDNLIFKLNGADAAAFASQGQQRSIVLSLKLSELKKVQDSIGQTPVLLLDDVLAELDEKRSALLLAAVSSGMQTLMSTTHLSAIDGSWLENAEIMTVENGALAGGLSLIKD